MQFLNQENNRSEKNQENNRSEKKSREQEVRRSLKKIEEEREEEEEREREKEGRMLTACEGLRENLGYHTHFNCSTHVFSFQIIIFNCTLLHRGCL